MRLDNPTAALEAAGLTVRPVGGAAGRGGALNAVQAVVLHDTVTTRRWSIRRVIELIRDGRSDLPGPLYQFGIDRDGVVYWVADGRANHNIGTYGNDSIGVAAFAAGALDGHEEPWNGNQREAAARLAAALCHRYGLPASRVVGHNETDPGRKPDPHGVDLDAIRDRTEALLDGATDAPSDDDDEGEEDDVATDVVVTDEAVYLIDHPYRLHVADPEAAEYFKNLAASEDNRQYEGPYEWDEERVYFHPEKG